MDSGREDFANNIEGLKAALVAERGERIIEAARAARAEAELRWLEPRPPMIKL